MRFSKIVPLIVLFLTALAIAGSSAYAKSFIIENASNLTQPYFAVNGTTGNVGIGTTSPGSFKLQVAGNLGPDADKTYNLGSASLRWSQVYSDVFSGSVVTKYSGSTGAGLTVKNLAEDNAFLVGYAGDSNLRVRSDSLFLWSSTVNPAFTTDLGLARNAAGVLEINSGTAGQYRDLQVRSINPTTGNVGIGTTSPGTTLSVNGNVSINGTIYNATWNGARITQTYLDGITIPGANVTGDLSAFENKTRLNAANITNGTFGAGNYYFQNDVYASKIYSEGGQVCTAANGFCASGTSTAGGWTNTSEKTTTTLNVNVTNGNLTVINGNVGIGTSSPSERLTVVGNINASGTINGSQLCIAGDCRAVWPSPGAANTTSNGTAGYIPKFTNETNIDNSAIYQNGSSIGIGTASPGTTLSVNGNMSVNGTIYNATWNGNPISQSYISGITIPNANVTGGWTIPEANVTAKAGVSGIAVANLTAGTFSGASWIWNGARISQTYLDGITLPATNVTGIGVTGIPVSNLTAGTFSGTSWIWNGARITQTYLDGITLPHANITNWIGVTIPEANITAKAGVSGIAVANLTAGTLSGTSWIWNGARISQTYLDGISIPEANVTAKAGVSGIAIANLTAGTLSGASWIWNGARITQTYLDGITIPNANVTGGWTIPAANVTAGTFPAGSFAFQNDLSVSGNLFVIGNLTNTNMNNLSVNASISPPTAFDNMFDLGTGARRWRYGYFGTDVTVGGYSVLTSNSAAGGAASGTFSSLTLKPNMVNIVQANITSGITIPNSNVTGGWTIPEANVTAKAGVSGIAVANLTAGTLGAGWTWQGTRITQTYLDGISIPEANVTAKAGVSNIAVANLTAGTFSGTSWVWNGARITQTYLDGITLPHANITNWIGVTIPEANITAKAGVSGIAVANLTAGTFTSSWIWNGARITQTYLDGISIPEANVTAKAGVSGIAIANLTAGTLTSSWIWNGARITQTYLDGITIPNANVTGGWILNASNVTSGTFSGPFGFTGTVNMSGNVIVHNTKCSAGQVLSTTADGTLQCVAGATANSTSNGTAGYIPKFTNSTNMDSSVIYQNGTNIGVGTTAPYAKLQVRAGTDQNLQFGPYGTGTYIQSSNDANTVVEPLMMSASSFAFLNGNVGIGTAGPNAKLEVNGTFLINQSGTTRVNVDSNGLVTVTGSLNITDNITVNGYIRGRPTDIAEMIPAADGEKIEAGDVVVADEKAVRKSRTAYDAAAIGVVSTEPGYVLGSHVDGVPLVLAGRVPVKVTGKGGAIRPGDMLTTSDKPGYAMKLTLLDINDAKDFADMKRIISENEKRKMSVIGKALESFDGEECKIIVLVGR